MEENVELEVMVIWGSKGAVGAVELEQEWRHIPVEGEGMLLED